MSAAKRLTAVAGTLSLAAGAALIGAAPASAGTTGTCYTDRPCLLLFYNSENKGTHLKISASISNLAGYRYPSGSAAGSGQLVKNNAASAQFRADNSFYPSSGTVFYNSGYAGPCDTFLSNELQWKIGPRLIRTYNENASVKIVAGFWADHPSNCFEW
ncbi:hypothetical protein [Streptomyces sp. NBC_00525]|uniref:hypothetical protein n=1 Tax=Streptomyces sp. NBC_00525 TaxID=2903660 RepID=UPI002E81B1EE|nr:hypothetical protein [Streptomyces sp. NBC_00525]WUC95500.1 hypothetical protein OG710_18745 [Streptomyces sp. NBC_00525]